MSMTISSMANDKMAMSMLRMSTGQRINSAADDASGLAISKALETQVRGLGQGTDNAAYAQNLTDTAEGGLSGMSDMLGRMRELAVQASNGIYSDSDRGLIQMEIDQLKEGIKAAATNTEYNGMKLLDGNFADRQVASNPNGSGMKISIENTTLESLGIKDFDVTKDFDISTIDSAIEKISTSRASLGATSNRLDHTINYNSVAQINQEAAKSSISDADYAKEISNLRKNEALQQYRIYTQKAQMNNQSSFLQLFS